MGLHPRLRRVRVFLLAVIATALLPLPANIVAQSSQVTSSSSAESTSAADDASFAGFQLVGGGIKAPKGTSTPDPKYPDLPEDAEPRGTVVLLIGVTAKGRVGPVRVLRSDESVFEKSAVETVKKWKFKPAEKDGKPVAVQITVELKFAR